MTAVARQPRQIRAVRTREALVQAGTVEFSQRGYAAATTKSIAQRAGVATGSFYQYFPNKDALLRELARDRLARVAQRSLALLEAAEVGHADPRSRLDEMRARMRAMVELVMDYHREDPGLHAVLTERRHADVELDAITTAGEKALVQRIAALLDRWDHEGDSMATAYVLFGTVEGSVHAHVLGHAMVSDDRFVTALVDALIRIALPVALLRPFTEVIAPR